MRGLTVLWLARHVAAVIYTMSYMPDGPETEHGTTFVAPPWNFGTDDFFNCKSCESILSRRTEAC